MKLDDNVVITQGERRIEAPSATYDTRTQGFKVDEGVTYSDPNLVVRGKGANLDPQAGATFEGAEFELPARNGRGAADR